MDSNGLDLSKILKMVTDNPAMLQTALSVAGKLKENINESPKKEDSPAPTEALSPAGTGKVSFRGREDEKRLLLALRPYLNEARREKIDFVLRILQLLELAGSLGFSFDSKSKGGGAKDV